MKHPSRIRFHNNLPRLERLDNPKRTTFEEEYILDMYVQAKLGTKELHPVDTSRVLSCTGSILGGIY